MKGRSRPAESPSLLEMLDALLRFAPSVERLKPWYPGESRLQRRMNRLNDFPLRIGQHLANPCSASHRCGSVLLKLITRRKNELVHNERIITN